MEEAGPDLVGAMPLDGWDLAFTRSPIGMAVLVDGRFVRANEALCGLLGRPLDEVIGTDAAALGRSFLSAPEVDGARAALEDGAERLHFEGTVAHPDGAERFVSVDVVILASDPVVAGRALTAVAMVTDVTDLHRARTELGASERRFRSLLTNISDTVSLTDGDGQLLYTTGAGKDVLGYAESFWHDRAPWDLIHPDDVEIANEAWERGMHRPGLEITTEVRMQASDGSWQDVSVTGVNLLDDPDVGGVVFTTRNITALRRAERMASTQASVLELIARGAPLVRVAEACVAFVEANGMDGASSIYLRDGDRLDVLAGRAPEALNRYLREPIRHAGRSLCDAAMAAREAVVLPDLTAGVIEPGLREVAEAEGLAAGWSQPIVSIATGEPVGSLSTVYRTPQTPTAHERQVADVACSLVAIALERLENEDRLAHQALHDGLTGLPNRTLLLDRLDHALARRVRNGRQIAVLFCDIDRFKVVNDGLGHSVGDQLLVAFAQRFRNAVDPTDTVARFGGDEFVILIEDVADDDHPLELANRLARALDAPFMLSGGHEVYVTASIGLTYASDHSSGEAWLRDADAAMYRAKEQGRNRLVLFDTEMRDAAMRRVRVEADLRRALVRDEIAVFFQPIVELASGRIVGAEALARWNHPERGLLLPSEFITVAEDTGMIDEAGRQVLDLAVGAAARLERPASLDRFQVSVNVSARQLSKLGLEDLVADACERHAWPPEDLLLEITEGDLIQGFDRPVDLLADIHALGVELAIDDFGTGYSSLARLGHLPVDQVKIDRSFVAAIGQPDEVLVRIVDAVAAIAGALGLRTTAEGVETDEQLAYLRALGCDQAQGYLFAPPLPIDDFAALLASDPRW
jgi:diguanylate cyclase (GGDEF)-like protein/PAS domain S-box-containing protein